MNVHHVHEEDDNQFHKCSHPSCNVTKERLKKYCLLRSKENKVLEKYEKAAKLHDTISKRRQSIAVSHLFSPFFDPNNYLKVEDAITSPKQRRFSVPNKSRPRSSLGSRSTSPQSLDTLSESLSDEELLILPYNGMLSPNTTKAPTRKISVTPTPHGSSPVISRKLSRSLTNLQHINVDELNNSLQILHDEADFYLERSRKLSTLNLNGYIDKQPYWQRIQDNENPHYCRGKTFVPDTRENEGNRQRQRSSTFEPIKKQKNSSRDRSFTTYTDEIQTQPYWQNHYSNTNISTTEIENCFRSLHRSDLFEENHLHTRRKEWIPTAEHMEAKKRLENRKNLMNKLDSDIHKVNKLIRDIKCKSLPLLSADDFNPLNDTFQTNAVIETF